MSTIDISSAAIPLSRIHSPRTIASQATPPVAPAIDDGDFYIGSTKINATPLHSAAQAARNSSAQ